MAIYFDGGKVASIRGLRGKPGPEGPPGQTGATGETGAPGKDGFSPTITVTDITGGHRVTITDATGPHSFDVMDGEDGMGGVSSFNGRTGAVVPTKGDYSVAQVTGAAPKESPEFTGSVSIGSATASGKDSYAQGFISSATGNYSHAQGWTTEAGGIASHAEGMGSKVLSGIGHAEGKNTIAGQEGGGNEQNPYHAEGYASKSTGSGSHAEGNETTASGEGSHAEGSGTIASGGFSHAEGSETTASDVGSHAEGVKTIASGGYSHAEGNSTNAKGAYSHAAGEGTIANNFQTVVGEYNVEKDNSTYTEFIVGGGSSGARKNAFRVEKSGACYGSGSWNTSGADYAELFEWADGNQDGEDRAGLFVALEGEKLRLATPDDDYIIGVVSATPSVVGDVYDDQWTGMHIKDVFGRVVMEAQDFPSQTVDMPDGTTIEVTPASRGLAPKLNPAYDQSIEYQPRTHRPEWDAVGLLGKLVAVDDGTCEVNGWATVGAGSAATASTTRTKYRVIARLDKTHVKLLIL